MDWKQLLVYISGSVDEELRLRNEFLAVENRILRAQVSGRVQLTDHDRTTLAEIVKRLGTRALESLATILKPGLDVEWTRKRICKQFDGLADLPGRCSQRPGACAVYES